MSTPERSNLLECAGPWLLFTRHCWSPDRTLRGRRRKAEQQALWSLKLQLKKKIKALRRQKAHPLHKELFEQIRESFCPSSLLLSETGVYGHMKTLTERCRQPLVLGTSTHHTARLGQHCYISVFTKQDCVASMLCGLGRTTASSARRTEGFSSITS